jgi:hypothetical protein
VPGPQPEQKARAWVSPPEKPCSTTGLALSPGRLRSAEKSSEAISASMRSIFSVVTCASAGSIGGLGRAGASLFGRAADEVRADTGF